MLLSECSEFSEFSEFSEYSQCSQCSEIIPDCMHIKEYTDYLRYELARSPHTVEAYTRDLAQFIAFATLGHPEDFDPSAIDTPCIRRWIASLALEKEAPASLRRKTQSLRAYFRFLCRRHSLKANPADDIILARLPKPLPDMIADPDMLRILRQSSPESSEKSQSTQSSESSESDQDSQSSQSSQSSRSSRLRATRDHLILHILYATGLRRSELLSLTDASISNSAREMKILGKGSKERIIPIAKPLLDEITEWQQLRDAEFPDLPTPRPIIATRHGAMSITALEATIKRLLRGERAGRKSPHTLRHTFATSMLNGGADLNAVQSLLGHSSLTSTQIYTHLQTSDIRDIYARAHPHGRKNSDSE